MCWCNACTDDCAALLLNTAAPGIDSKQVRALAVIRTYSVPEAHCALLSYRCCAAVVHPAILNLISPHPAMALPPAFPCQARRPNDRGGAVVPTPTLTLYRARSLLARDGVQSGAYFPEPKERQTARARKGEGGVRTRRGRRGEIRPRRTATPPYFTSRACRMAAGSGFGEKRQVA